MSEPGGYILTEIWKARPSWEALSKQDRVEFFERKIGPLLGEMVQAGAEILCCAINDNEGSERIDYDYMAVWKMPGRELSNRLESAAKAAGFLDYFEQVNISGHPITPDALNGHMIDL